MKAQFEKVVSTVLAVTITLVTLIAGIATNAEESPVKISGLYSYTTNNNEVQITKCDTSATGVITVPATLEGLPVTVIGEKAFSYCNEITHVVLSDGVRTISDMAFMWCGMLAGITLPNSLLCIGESILSGSYMVTSVTVPKSVKQIEPTAFTGCESLSNIFVVADNPYFCSLDGVIYNKDKTELIAYPPAKVQTQYSVPQGVTVIWKSAFSYAKKLLKVYLPDSLSSISDYAFFECNALAEITLPEQVHTIGTRAFGECSSITNFKIPANVDTIGFNAFKNCKNINILCYFNSNAKKHAVAQNIKYTIVSVDYDASGNGIVDVSDCVFLRRFLVGTAESEPSEDADCNKDGQKDIKDLVHIKKFFAGK